jgi:cytochrome c oxidase cbb3-type subunit 4
MLVFTTSRKSRLDAAVCVTRRTIMNVTIYLLVLIAAFIGIVVWVFSRKRKARFERDARIPFEDGNG